MKKEDNNLTEILLPSEDVYHVNSPKDSEEDYRLHNLFNSAVLLRTQPDEEVSSPGTSSVPPDVSFDPTDAEPRKEINVSFDPTDAEPRSLSVDSSAISPHAQPDEIVSSPDNALLSSADKLGNTSVIDQAVSSDPIDAELQNSAVDSSAILLHAQPDKIVSSPDNALPSSANKLVNTSVILQAVSSDPTDAEPQNSAVDSSGVVPDTSLDDSIKHQPLNDSSSVSLTKKSQISDEELEKYIDQMPPELKVKPVHCLIMCSKEDIEDADKFRKHLITDIKIKKHYPVTAVLDKGPEFSSLGGAVLSHTEECFKRSTYTFIYMTENLLSDNILLHQIESLLVASLKTKDNKRTIVPVYPRQECTQLVFPSFLTALRGIEPFKDNEHYRNHLTSLIEGKSYVCVKENEELRKKQEDWITQNCKNDAATGGNQKTQVRLVSIPGLDTDNKKRWHTVGLCLNIVLSTALKHVGPLIEKLFKDLEISEQTKDKFLEKHGETPLSYKVINGNANRKKKEEYDYNIRNAVDFSKCLVPHQAHKYTDFNDSCKLETRLYFLRDIDRLSITADCQELAKEVVKIRNNWAHCDFSEWTDDFYRNALSLIEELLKNLKLKPEEENRFLGDLEEMKDHCHNLIHGITCDLSFFRDLLNKTVELLKCVTEDKIVKAEIVKIIESLQSVLDTFIA